MGALSRMRKDSSTAFFNHSLTTRPPSFFSAMRLRPASKSRMAVSTAAFSSTEAEEGLISALFSKASLMIFTMDLSAPDRVVA